MRALRGQKQLRPLNTLFFAGLAELERRVGVVLFERVGREERFILMQTFW